MDDVIQCPSCSKKYRLKGAPPPTFQCRNCGTVMDLSAFSEAPAEPAAPASPAPPARAGAGRASRSAAPARSGRPGRARGRSAARGGRGRARDRDEDDGYDEDEGRPRYQRKQGANTPLIIGAVAAVVVAAVALLIWSGSRPDQEEEKKPKTVAVTPYVPPTPPPDVEPKPKPKPKVIPGREDETRPELREGSFADIAIPEGKRKYRWSQAQIKDYPWPDYVTAEEREKIEAAVETFEWGGADQVDAEDYLAGLDAHPIEGEKFRAVGRLISEFKRILDHFEGKITDMECMARLMIVDRVLRRIDGMQQRDFADRMGIRSQSTDSEARKAMKRWNWWYDLEKWRLRREPWDQREDLADPEDDELEELPED